MRYLDLNEGPNDPNIFKAVIMAGGPGSGKGYVSDELSLESMGLRKIDSDQFLEYLMQQHNLDLTMPPEEDAARDIIRNRAKQLATTKQNLAIDGRLGLVIDGTAKDVEKIAKVKDTLEKLGYQVMMVFVDTSLRTSMERNNMRKRRVPSEIVVASHRETQKNKLALNNLFAPNYIEVNNEGVTDFNSVQKVINRFLKTPVTSVARDWVSKQRVRTESDQAIANKINAFEDVSVDQLSKIEQYADVLFNKVGINVEFTRHFIDRVNDVRNRKPINSAELIRLFKQEYMKWGKPIARLGPDAEAVMKDMQTDINMPFVLNWDRQTQQLDLVAKTVMRKQDFKTPDPVFAVESVDEAIVFPIPRDQMPQIDIDHVQDDFKVRRGTISFSKLRPVQTDRVPGLVNKTIDMILQNRVDKPIMVDKNGYIVNGHHRYDAYKKLGAKPDFQVPAVMIFATLEEIIDKYPHTTSNDKVVSEASLKKNKWGLIITDQDKNQWGEELIALVNNAYDRSSLGSFVQDMHAVTGSEWAALDWDQDPDVDCTIFFRKNRGNETWSGFKVQGIGHDGSPESKNKIMNRLVLSLAKPGYWIESSESMARALAKRGAVPITDEATCKAVFPNTNLKMIDSDTGLYQREANGKVIEEIIYGKPNVLAPVNETCSGSIATVVMPMGKIQRRSNPSIYNYLVSVEKSGKKKK